MYKKHIDVNEVAAYIADKCGPETKVYVGCDSERLNVSGTWYADYITVVVVHINGNSGCKIFGAVERERDYDQRSNKPRMRLMNEAYKVSGLYLELAAVVDLDIEVHLDLNPSELHVSNMVLNEAVGYVKGMCNVIPMVKPNGWAASYAADRYKEIVHLNRAA